jgi:hypothetical protein
MAEPTGKMMKQASRVIALDCDGVLLDYGSAYGLAWERAFGDRPTLCNPHAYWPIDRWGVPRLSGPALAQLRQVFDDTFWRTIPAVEGAAEACELLVQAGYELICVTALDPRYLAARQRNLRELGFPLSQVYATDSQNTASGASPKAALLNRLRPACFVDDYAPYLKGVDDEIHKVLITRDPVGSPNTGPLLDLAHSCFQDLLAFASDALRSYAGNDLGRSTGMTGEGNRHEPS